MAARATHSPARRPARAGVSIETRTMADGTERFYARYTDARGKRLVVKSPGGRSSWADWGEAFTAGCVAQVEAERLTYRSRDGERLLFRDLVRDHYLPSLRDASLNTRKNTASHLGDGSGVPTRHSSTAVRAARSQLLFAFGHLPLGAIGPNEVQQWISQMNADGYEISTLRAKRSLLRTILQVAVDQGWLVQNVVTATRLPGRPIARRGTGHHPRGVGRDPAAAVRRGHAAAVRPGVGRRRAELLLVFVWFWSSRLVPADGPSAGALPSGPRARDGDRAGPREGWCRAAHLWTGPGARSAA